MQQPHLELDQSDGLKNDQRVTVLAPVFFYFVVAGLATVMLGPLLPVLVQRWNIQDAQAGTLFTASFAGQLCGAWFAARNLRVSVIFGALLSAAGCIMMIWASFSTAHLALFCIGTGLGAGLTAGNIVVGTSIPALRGRLLAILNVAWGLGAIACPLLVHVSATRNVAPFFLIVSVALVIASGFAATVPQAVSPAALSEASSSPQSASRMLLLLVPLLVFGAALPLYIGIENSLNGWLPSYAVRTNPSIQASTITLCFWTAELAGRLLVAALMSRVGEAILFRLCLTSLIVTEALLCVTVHLSPGSMVAITILSGLTLAPLYPLTISFLLARTGNHPGLGPLFALASVGGATLPWLTGVISTEFNSLRSGLAVPAFGAIAFLLLSKAITVSPPAKPEM
ncbi:MAG TPA: MFS transporter [Edaphobacter sp.]|nr:MFS transporter [Edaphobacter sp.]